MANNQESQQENANAENLYNEQRRRGREYANRIPDFGRLPDGYGPARGFHGIGFRTQPYNQGWRDTYNPHDELTLAEAVRGT